MHGIKLLLSQGTSLLRYASHSNLPTTSIELSTVALRVGSSPGAKAKPGKSPAVSVVDMEHVDC